MWRRSEDPDIKTNLVIVPLSLLSQWEDEIRTKCLGMRTHIYHGSNKHKATSIEQLLPFDVVLTTHSTLMLELPKKDSEREPGLLFNMTFYRVICDEAHFIRNRSTRVSKAVTKIDAVYRWVLTGTPVVNSLADLFPLLRFLRYRLRMDWTHFRQWIVKPEKAEPVEMGREAEKAIAEVRLRRVKTDLLDGEPLVKLKPKVINLTTLFIDEDERACYDVAEKEAQVKISKYLKKGTLLYNWSHIFVLIRRLRQLTIHPSLITVDGSGGAIHFIEEVKKAMDFLGETKVEELRAKRMAIAVARCLTENGSKAADENDDDGSCPVCMEVITPGSGVALGCLHVFCYPCAEEVLNGPAVEVDVDDRRLKKDERPCPNCRTPFSSETMFDLDVFEPAEEAVEEEAKMANTIVIDGESEDELPTVQELVKRFGDRKPNVKAESKSSLDSNSRTKTRSRNQTRRRSQTRRRNQKRRSKSSISRFLMSSRPARCDIFTKR